MITFTLTERFVSEGIYAANEMGYHHLRKADQLFDRLL